MSLDDFRHLNCLLYYAFLQTAKSSVNHFINFLTFNKNVQDHYRTV